MFRISFEISGTKCTQQVSFRGQQCILGWSRIILSHLLIWFNAQIKMKTVNSIPSFQWGEGFHNNASLEASPQYKHFLPRKFWIHKMNISHRYLQTMEVLQNSDTCNKFHPFLMIRHIVCAKINFGSDKQ